MIRRLLGICLMLGTMLITPQVVAQRPIPVAVQLWSVRDALQADFQETLSALAAMGFDGVEFAGDFGPYGDDPSGLRTLLDSLGLRVAGAHVSTEQLRGADLQATLSFHQALGTPYLVVPYDERAWDAQGVKALAKELNALATEMGDTGIRVGYHNHAEEFGAFGDATYWDALARSTVDQVVLQQDVGWSTFAGKDPAAYVRRYPGRTLTTHYKVKPGPGAEGRPFVGEGPTDWHALLRANVEAGGTRWLVVEQEDYPEGMTPMECVELSLRGLEKVMSESAGGGG